MAQRMDRAGSGTAAMSPCLIEPLEPRRFMSATLTVENLDVIPGFERLIFNRIRTPNTDIPNVVKDRGTLRLTNSGNQTLRLDDFKVSGPFKVLGMPPTSIPAGKSVSVTVEFTASTPPAFTFNQTNGTGRATLAGVYNGTLSFTTNDPANPTYSEALAGWFQTESEKDQEPSLQTFVNLIADYKTQIASSRQTFLTEGDQPTYYGEEVISGYWQAADTSKTVRVRQLTSFHTQGEPVKFNWFKKTNGAQSLLFTTDGRTGQSFLPSLLNQLNVPATGSFAPGSSVFGLRIDNEYSDDSLNKNQTGGGHHIRFYPVRDHFGNILDNSYFVAMDYSVAGSQNYDFQDNIYIITNVKPAGN